MYSNNNFYQCHYIVKFKMYTSITAYNVDYWYIKHVHKIELGCYIYSLTSQTNLFFHTCTCLLPVLYEYCYFRKGYTIILIFGKTIYYIIHNI